MEYGKPPTRPEIAGVEEILIITPPPSLPPIMLLPWFIFDEFCIIIGRTARQSLTEPNKSTSIIFSSSSPDPSCICLFHILASYAYPALFIRMSIFWYLFKTALINVSTLDPSVISTSRARVVPFNLVAAAFDWPKLREQTMTIAPLWKFLCYFKTNPFTRTSNYDYSI